MLSHGAATIIDDVLQIVEESTQDNILDRLLDYHQSHLTGIHIEERTSNSLVFVNRNAFGIEVDTDNNHVIPLGLRVYVRVEEERFIDGSKTGDTDERLAILCNGEENYFIDRYDKGDVLCLNNAYLLFGHNDSYYFNILKGEDISGLVSQSNISEWHDYNDPRQRVFWNISDEDEYEGRYIWSKWLHEVINRRTITTPLVDNIIRSLTCNPFSKIKIDYSNIVRLISDVRVAIKGPYLSNEVMRNQQAIARSMSLYND